MAGIIIGGVIGYPWEAVKLTMAEVFVLIGPGLVLAIVMNCLGGFVERQAYRTLGRRLYIWLFGWLDAIVLFAIVINLVALVILLMVARPLGWVLRRL